MKKRLPLRPSTLAEREEFYKNEFSISKVKAWFKKNKIPLPQVCALDPGSETDTIKDPKLKGYMLYFPFRELKKQIRKYAPEDLYYDRSTYKDPEKFLKNIRFHPFIKQELVFDVDSDNIPCTHPKKEQVCNICIKKAFGYAKKLKSDLEKIYKKVILVYSGRGFHLHILDQEAYHLSIEERQALNEKFKKYPFDPWVTRGKTTIRLMRMPHSLNSLVSRKVTPIENNNFKDEKSIPRFLKSKN